MTILMETGLRIWNLKLVLRTMMDEQRGSSVNCKTLDLRNGFGNL